MWRPPEGELLRLCAHKCGATTSRAWPTGRRVRSDCRPGLLCQDGSRRPVCSCPGGCPPGLLLRQVGSRLVCSCPDGCPPGLLLCQDGSRLACSCPGGCPQAC